ncbi:MAG: GIY-YIG nuclease family protein [Alphaproteobacteria bacterium]
MKKGYTYILTNKKNGTLYIGVTSDLVRRIWEHKNHVVDGFSKKYNLTLLVYFEVFDEIETAIEREKQLKGQNRQKKLDLINATNPTWTDLYNSICQ